MTFYLIIVSYDGMIVVLLMEGFEDKPILLFTDPARVTYTPTVQYLPFRQQGIIKCFIKSNPPIQFVTWIKDKRLFDAEKENTVVKLNNGSLLITKVCFEILYTENKVILMKQHACSILYAHIYLSPAPDENGYLHFTGSFSSYTISWLLLITLFECQTVNASVCLLVLLAVFGCFKVI